MVQESGDPWSELLTVKSISNPNSINKNGGGNGLRGRQNAVKNKKAGDAPKLVKSSLKSKWFEGFGQQKQPTLKKKNSMVSFVEGLKQIERKTQKLDIIDETNEDIEIAFKQLDELKKLLAEKIRKQAIHESNTQPIKYEEITKSSRVSAYSKILELNRKLDSVKKNFYRKPRVHYKSLKDFDDVLLTMETEINTDMEILEKPESPHRLSHLQVKPTASTSTTTASNNKNIAMDNYYEKILYKNPISATFGNDSDSDQYFDDDIEEKAAKAETCTQCEDAPEKFGELISYAFGNSRQKASLYKSVFKNSNKLEESILKSQYLLKEFSTDSPAEGKFFQVDKNKAAEKKSVQLFETAIHKFRDRQTCEVANLKGRDRKLYTTLNLSLKNSLYTTIEE